MNKEDTALTLIGIIAIIVVVMFVEWWALNLVIDWFLATKGLKMGFYVRLSIFFLYGLLVPRGTK